MTIYERIQEALEEMKGKQTLYDRASKLNTSVEELIQEQLIAHLGEIDNQMPEYDTHDRTHSEKVLENIEKLLRDEGIRELSFLEALTLRLCCYFHDAGMILPQCYVPLMERVEKDPSEDPGDGVDAWLAANKKGYPDISKQFYCPDSASGFEDFLIEQLELYQKYCMGLPEKPENISETDYFREKRHDYLRSTHGDRVRVYSKNMAAKFLDGLTGSGREDLQKAVGDICASHCWEIGEVKKLATKLELQTSCPEMTCNVRYMAMLLRLGDVLHFSSDRVNQTVYAERNPMGAVNDRHWTVKLGDLSYTISTDKKDRKIAFDGSFEDPKSYYFLQDHLNWMDEELKNYAYFVSDMHGELDSARYALGLPTEVDRERVRAVGFKPDQNLKFKLEHQKIITLLMGMRLYRDEFMCLRELYQNALDACRCMRAENESKDLRGDLEIEFGLGTDDGGDYLYCKDQGTGMTMDIVKNYLLRIGNSYYQSAEFRRANAGWGGKVAPVSEFGIGLLSCYMIASRIEVITRHYTKTAEDTIWISMESSDDYGYFKNPGRREKKWVGDHGTIVKLYLLDKYKNMVTGYAPENPDDTLFILEHCRKGEVLNRLANSLYARIRRFIVVPELGIDIFVNTDTQRLAISKLENCYDLTKKLPMLVSMDLDMSSIIGRHYPDQRTLFGKRVNNGENSGFVEDLQAWRNNFQYYSCAVEDEVTRAGAITLIHLPRNPEIEYQTDIIHAMDQSAYGGGVGYIIDGMPISAEDRYQYLGDEGIIYLFSGVMRPNLTVDRGEIRSFSTDVKKLIKQLSNQLCQTVADQIRKHFSAFPNATTDAAQKYLVYYLFHKFDKTFAKELLKELSTDVLCKFSYYGAPLSDWFNNTTIETKANFLLEDESYGRQMLAHDVIRTAAGIRIEQTKLIIQKNKECGNEDSEEKLFPYQLAAYVIRCDNWPDIYSQYDAVREYAGLVPEHVFELIHDYKMDVLDGDYVDTPHGLSNHSRKHAKRMKSTDWMLPSAWTMRTVDPVHMSFSRWEDVILSLQEYGKNSKIYQCSDGMPFIEGPKHRYVFYVYINPRSLTEEDKAYVEQFDHIPKYREGVNKGWSILFYNYKKGYVIAPGIVDRVEMLKLLPQEALEHDDGLEYYFTDGTRAF